MQRTVDDLMQAWWAIHRPTIADTTAYHQLQTIRLHISPYIGHINVAKLGKDDLAYLNDKSPNIQLCVHKILNPSLRWAMEQKWCRKNIMATIQRPKVQSKEIEIYKMEELAALLTYLTGRWLWLPVYLAARTGLRRGEVCGLQWDDIDLDHGFLTVRRAIVTVSPRDVYIHQPKTRKSTRRVDLDPDTVDVLRARKATAKTIWVCAAPRREGGMPNPWHIPKQLKQACIAAGVQYRTFHTLRHTHATMLMADEVHPKIVAERLGHSNTQITVDTYSHIIPTMQAAAVAAVSRIFALDKPPRQG